MLNTYTWQITKVTTKNLCIYILPIKANHSILPTKTNKYQGKKTKILSLGSMLLFFCLCLRNICKLCSCLIIVNGNSYVFEGLYSNTFETLHGSSFHLYHSHNTFQNDDHNVLVL